MSAFELIPTCDDPMSSTTVCVIAICISTFILFATIYIRYNSNEIRRVEKDFERFLKKLETAINGHDEYIDDTNGVINKIHIDLAVQESSMTDLKADLSEIKADIKTLLKRN